MFSTGEDGRLHQWDVESGEEQLAYGAPQGRPSPNTEGLVLVPSSEGPIALLIDTSLRGEIASVDNTALASQEVPNGGCGTAFPGQAVAAGGQLVAATNICGQEGTPDGEVLSLFDRTSLQPLGSADGGFVSALSPDGTRLARRTQRLDGEDLFVGPVEVVDVASGNKLVELQGLCWYDRTDPSEGVLRQARRDDANEGCNEFPQTPFAMDGWQAHAIRWSPDGTMIAMVDLVDRYFGVWNATDGTLITNSLAASDDNREAFDIAFTPDSKHIIVSYTAEPIAGATLNALAKISTTDWRVEAIRELPIRARNLLLLGAALGDGSMVAVGGFLSASDKTLYWINLNSLADAQRVCRASAADVLSAAMSADGALVATGAADGSVRVWDSTGRVVNEMEFPGLSVMGLAFVSPTHLGVVLEDGNVRVVTIDTDESCSKSRVTR